MCRFPNRNALIKERCESDGGRRTMETGAGREKQVKE